MSQTDGFLLYFPPGCAILPTTELMKLRYAVILFLTLACQAQRQYTGIIRDEVSGKPLPFAGIFTDSGLEFRTDLDGKFALPSESTVVKLRVFSIGYETQEIALSDKAAFYKIALKPNPFKDEIEQRNRIRGDEIIQKVISAKAHNDPQKKCRSFEFKSYNRLIISANPDSIHASIDSTAARKSFFRKNQSRDSSSYKFKEFISRRHLFQTERVSYFQFRGKELKENIMGTKMAGFKQPVHEILSVNLQSFSIYDEQYELFETSYKSPISKLFTSEYQFCLLDSTQIGERKSWLIHFKNKKNHKKTGLEGLLYIDAENYAVNKAVMRIKGLLDITGIHEFDYYPTENLWFPSKKAFKIVKGKNNYDLRILGETLSFDSGKNESSLRKKEISDFTYLLSESKILDVAFNGTVFIRNPYQQIEIEKNAESRDEIFWNRYRTEKFDTKGRETYTYLDSIATIRNIEKKFTQGRKLLNGYVPFGYLDLDLRSLLSFNNFEGFRLGLGGKTSDLLSKQFRIEGYTAYGTKDDAFKYSAGISANVNHQTNSRIGVSFTDDIKELASSTFAIDKRNFKLYDPRPINLKTFYAYQSWRAYFETKAIPKTESIFQIILTDVQPLFDYIFSVNGKAYSQYNITVAQFALQWNPFSDYLQSENGRFEVKKRYPKFTLQYNQTLRNLWSNDFSYKKIDFRVEYEKNHLNGQKSSLLLESAYASGELPLTHAYNTSPNNLTNDRLIGRLTIAGKNSFETMYFNEFFSSEFVMIHLKHSFRRLEIHRKVKPEFVLVTRAVWGDMKNKERHLGPSFSTLDKGYYESGFEINQIYSGFGLVAFCRYGPYQLTRLEDNLAVKLSFVLNLGF